MLVSEWLDFVAGLRDIRGAERRSSLDEAIAATGIEAVYHRPIGELSKGFRQRVGLAAAILHRPDLLVLDEPTEGLDPNQRVEIRRLIGQLGRERTVILSTHILPEVQFTCSRLLIINRGRSWRTARWMTWSRAPRTAPGSAWRPPAPASPTAWPRCPASAA